MRRAAWDSGGVFLHPTQGVAEAQIPPRTAGGPGRGSPRIPPCGRERGLESPTGAFVPFGTGQLAISFALHASQRGLESPTGAFITFVTAQLRKLKSPPEGRGAHGGTGPPVRADLPRRGGPSAEGPRPLPPFRKGGGAEGPGGFHFQPEGLAARRLVLKDCKMTPTGTPTAGRGKCRHTYFLPTCLAAFAGGT